MGLVFKVFMLFLLPPNTELYLRPLINSTCEHSYSNITMVAQSLTTWLCSRLPSASHPGYWHVSRKKGGNTLRQPSSPCPHAHFSQRPSAERHEPVWTAACGSSISRWKNIWVFRLNGENPGTISAALAGSSVSCMEPPNISFLSSGNDILQILSDSGLSITWGLRWMRDEWVHETEAWGALNWCWAGLPTIEGI